MTHCRPKKTLLARCRRAGGLLAAALTGTFMVVVTGPAASAQGAEGTPPSGACFDIVRSDATVAAILLNRCTGQTWILVRRRGRHGNEFAYRWRPVARGATEVAANPPAPVVPHVHIPASPNSDKCFTFQGRRFCE